MSIISKIKNLFKKKEKEKTVLVTIESKDEKQSVYMPEESAYLLFMVQAVSKINALEEQVTYLSLPKKTIPELKKSKPPKKDATHKSS